ncbi:MAG TPA: lysine transporter LysE [Chloroflexi bacterium]|nr:lysine transporter LysE [Chloroflexota bacterium]
MLAYLLKGLTLGFSAAASPGPLLAYFLAQSVKNGWRRTLPAALAPLLSDGPIILLVLLILTQTPAWLLRGLQIAGGLFLLYLAWGAFQTFRSADFSLSPTGEMAQRGLVEAALVNLLNPNPYLFWSLIGGPILLEGWRRSASLGASFLIGFYGTLIGGFAGFILLFATAGRLDARLGRLLSGLSALALFLFGLYQLWMGIALLTPGLFSALTLGGDPPAGPSHGLKRTVGSL